MSSRWNFRATGVVQRWLVVGAALLLAAGLYGQRVWWAPADDAHAQQPAAAAAEAAVADDGSVALAQLPRQVGEVYRLVLAGGPFGYDQDGRVFANRERLLPLEPRGYWREYTVPTPGARDRGARRLVCGGESRSPQVCYYTDDHYASFRRVVP